MEIAQDSLYNAQIAFLEVLIMKKATAFLKPIFTFLAVTALLSSCAKTDYDGSLRNRNSNDPQGQTQGQPQGQQQGRSGTTPDAGAGAGLDANLPVISFTQSEVLMDSRLDAKLELQLSAASNNPVVAEINLLDGTARHHRDYSGFKNGSPRNETVQTVIFAPGELRKSLPAIRGKVRYADTSRSCNSDFMARINAMKLQGARVLSDRAKIIVPCSTDRADILPPLPDTGTVTPVNPNTELPMASFENYSIEVPVGADIALGRIVLDRAPEEPVYIDVKATTEFRVKTFEPYNERVMIPRGQRSVDIRVRVKRQDICCSRHVTQGDEVTGRFKLNVLSIANATMENRVADVAVKDNSVRCAQRPSQPTPPTQPTPPDLQPVPPTEPPPSQPVAPSARFEQEQILTDGKEMVTSKIILNVSASQDIAIDLETEDGTAKSDVDYVPLKVTLTIKKDESSIDIPLALIKRDKCVPDAGADAGKGGDFKLVVKNITNASMEVKTESIVIPADTRTCEPATTPTPTEPPAPVNPPTPEPPAPQNPPVPPEPTPAPAPVPPKPAPTPAPAPTPKP